ncbi:MAG: T9SS type A sorting domain-containing protein [Bacteroidales bacterium]|nr:T9SS type A sorting domain-containing protein [Bacteroidales bacterium]
MRRILNAVPMILIGLILSSWGYKGHRIISQNVPACFPEKMAFLNPGWTNVVTLHASDPDNRKNTDPNEASRHYIDIDNYPEFIVTGRIPQTYDSVISAHPGSFVIDQGILPWATLVTFDSLKRCFQRRDWNKSALFAADLSHYVGDGHMPLHITKNYEGQMTGQNGVHSRYESKMISQFENQLVYPSDPVEFIPNVNSYVFSYLYNNYMYVDSILLADNEATIEAGGIGTSAYYNAFWARTGNFTLGLMRHASFSLASLIYTAWVEAGSPTLYPNAVSEIADLSCPRLLPNFPNPFASQTNIAFEISVNNTPITIMIYDEAGNLKDTIANTTFSEGYHKILWNVGATTPGVYICVMKSGSWSETRKMIIGN